MPLSVEEAPTALSCEELNAMFLGGPALSSASLETGGFGAPRGADLGMQKQREASLGVSRVTQLPHHW